MNKIAILGSGALGLALSINFSKNENINEVLIYSRKPEIVSAINDGKKYLFDEISLSEKIRCTNDFSLIENYEIIFITVNSPGFLDIIEKLSKLNFSKTQPLIVICTKSIGYGGRFLNSIAKEKLKNEKIALLYGPSFAHEIAYGEITCVNFVYHDYNSASNYLEFLVDSNTNLKMIQINDYIGAQICSVMKNICAIYMGVFKGFGAKNDFLAIIFKFFIEEILEAIKIHGGNERTIFSLCGIGDLFLTCTSFDSRNYSFGYAIGLEKNIQKTLEKYHGNYPEGYLNLKNLLKLNSTKNFHSNLCEQLYNFLQTNEDFNINSLKNFLQT
jgi:glycerol-3-phosphate dehydrogenase (NAD(P)+)